jgi:cyclopropane-fatty-acyl-phospholipid synthase
MDIHKEEIMPILAKINGSQDASKWFMRWRIFFMAYDKLFAHGQGQKWYASHCLFERNSEGSPEMQA